MKALKKILLVLFTALLGCIFVGCLSTKVKVSYIVDGREYSSREYELNEQISLPDDPTVEGKTFIGWYLDEALTTPYTEGKVTYEMTLYAKFSVSTVYIIVNVDGGETISPIAVTPGSQYTVPEAEKEGYTFLGYTYIDETGLEQPFPLSGQYSGNVSIRITAKYAINKYDVTFVNGSNESYAEVEHNGTVIAPATDKAGYTFDGWYTSATEQTDETKFDLATKITEEVTLYAKYSPKTFTITVNNAQAGYTNPTAVYGEAYTVVAPDRGANYEFMGFLLNGAPFEATGTYIWTTDITVDTVWEGSGRDILFYDGTNVINRIEGNYEDDLASFALPAVPAKTGYTTDGVWYTDSACTTAFVAEGALTTELKLYAKYTANTYKVTFTVYDSKGVASQVTCDVVYGQAVQNAPAKAERGSYDFKGYFYGETAFDPTQAYTYTENINVTEKWTLKADASLFEYNASGNYFREKATYDDNWTFVYLIKGGAEEDGYAYNFGDVTLTMVTAGGDAYATIDGGKLLAKAPGSFELKITYANGSETIMTAKVVEYVKSFGLGGTNYESSWGKTVDGKLIRNTTDVWNKKTEDTVMKVGRTNFIPEININSNTLTISQINAEISVEADGAETTSYNVVNGAINFGADLSGKTVKITIAPKYAVDVDHVVEITVQLNEGLNVYTNSELKAAYKNTAVTEINVLRNITVELDDTQKNVMTADANGNYTNPSGKTYTLGSAYTTIVSPKNGKTGGIVQGTGVYERSSGDLKINGNYFTVDGSNIPLVDARDGDRDYHKETYWLQNVHFSIFSYGLRGAICYDTMTMENLNVIGNNKDDASMATYKVTEDGAEGEVVKYSGACINIQVGSGTLALNNVTSRRGAFAVNAYGNNPVLKEGSTTEYTQSCHIVATDCNFANSWSNNIYVYGFASVTLNSSYVGIANGAAIHFDSSANNKGAASEATLNINGDTEISNWVLGSEAWFMVYGASQQVGMLKAGIEGFVKYASAVANNGVPNRTVSKGSDENQMVNFAVLMKTVGETSEYTNGKDTDTHGTLVLNQDGAAMATFNPDLDTYLASQQMKYDGSVYSNYVKAGTNAMATMFGYMEIIIPIINA